MRMEIHANAFSLERVLKAWAHTHSMGTRIHSMCTYVYSQYGHVYSQHGHDEPTRDGRARRPAGDQEVVDEAGEQRGVGELQVRVA